MDTHKKGGYQCDLQAIMMRDGRRVCHSHGNIANAVMFTDGGGNSDAYAEFSRTIVELSILDTGFFDAAKSAISSIENPSQLQQEKP
jgi:hypothetical protein